MGDFWDNFKHAVRMFRANPGFTLAAVAALALGIGINTAIFTVVDAVLLKPLTYPDADRIVQFLTHLPAATAPAPPCPVSYLGTADERLSGCCRLRLRRSWLQPDRRRPEQVHGIHVTQGYFRLFGAPLILGRTFTPQEDSPNGGKVVVLSYGLWQRKFGGNPNIIGTPVSGQ